MLEMAYFFKGGEHDETGLCRVAGVSGWPKGLFEPEAVAVIGASDQPGSLGCVLVQNLLASYRGALYCAASTPHVRPSRTGLPTLQSSTYPL
jgi:hypothetical protein